MAALGQVRETFWEQCTPASIAFAQGFRALVNGMTSDKQHVRAQQLGIAPSTLSNYWIGRRIPWQSKLRALFKAARRNSAGAAPVTLAALERLRSYARLKQSGRNAQEDRDACAASAIGGLADGAQASGTDAPDSGTVPAAGPAQDRRNSGNTSPREKPADREEPEAAETTRPEGAESGTVGETLGILRAARASGNLRELVGTAWSASRTFSEADFCTAVAGLQATGDTDLAEALLLADGQRGPAATTRLALALMGAGLGSSAELVMRASLPAEASLER
ncbi:hypothetical protein ACIQRS_12060 [Streptomyces termitum]|uniref:Uncharacterized protein n=1 Tax=Streptomyces termitum TaxID=67368 RepID=A0A918W5F9_9ACTN|nr:hypothetical protein [Streptomyces termitum]GHA70627.1 hypothetical protein GCM10010305_11320 [Streptomyces termitum]